MTKKCLTSPSAMALKEFARRDGGRDSSSAEAHTTSDSEMEGGTEGAAQWAVHSWDRPGLGIHRDTVKKYMNAESPPMARGRAKSTVS